MENEQKHPISDLAKAYTAAWGEIDNVVKNSHNPHFGSNYADLGACLDTVRAVFRKHGLALLQSPGKLTEVGGMVVLGLTGCLIHSSGQHINMEMSIPIGPVPAATKEDAAAPGDWKAKKKGGSKVDAQKTVAAVTYARRVQLAAVGGIAQVDDDGNGVVAEEPEEKPRKGTPTAVDSSLSYAQVKEALLADIAATKTAMELTGTAKEFSEIRTRVEALNDQEVADAYLARRAEFKSKKETV